MLKHEWKFNVKVIVKSSQAAEAITEAEAIEQVVRMEMYYNENGKHRIHLGLLSKNLSEKEKDSNTQLCD